MTSRKDGRADDRLGLFLPLSAVADVQGLTWLMRFRHRHNAVFYIPPQFRKTGGFW